MNTQVEPLIQPRLPMRETLPAVTPMEMLRLAVEKGADVGMLEKLMGLQERWEANEARKAFVAAINAFKADPPTVIKNKHAGFDTRQGGKTEYDYADLAMVVGVVGPALMKHGLSHRWETVQGANGLVAVTCVLTHVLGHSERATLEAGADTSGSKNAVQAIGSTVSYLARYSLLLVTGLAARGIDDDAGGIVTWISAEQKEQLVALQREVRADTEKFLKYLGVSALDRLPADKFASAMAALAKKKEKHA